MLKVLTVCGAGVGSSMMLKVFTEKILKEEGVEGTVNAVDIGSVSGGQDADVIITTPELAQLLQNVQAKVIALPNLMDRETLKKELLQIIHAE
ncbi:PTS sugar transporter subunit IIB [Numidum massiliense]|uniref:PTS sugar transporter subunit IIB n=1 Tax=Numidum massiliense TaxID=1522315 RepID=UPI0006D54E25|nr:PTS sugar transporter subunit IIB [Numidum massiliense]